MLFLSCCSIKRTADKLECKINGPQIDMAVFRHSTIYGSARSHRSSKRTVANYGLRNYENGKHKCLKVRQSIIYCFLVMFGAGFDEFVCFVQESANCELDSVY